MRKLKSWESLPQFPTLLVFQAAAEAYLSSNKQYVRADAGPEEGVPNKEKVKRILTESLPISSEAQQYGQDMLDYFQGLILKALAGKFLSDWNKEALNIANEETTSMRLIGKISYFPVGYEKWSNIDRVNETMSESRGNTVGKVGDKVELTLTILACSFNTNYNRYMVKALTPDKQGVTFWSNNDWSGTVKVRAKIKDHSDGFTVLTLVRKAKES
jgi:hypothetical protein